jgi:hypothetical protein
VAAKKEDEAGKKEVTAKKEEEAKRLKETTKDIMARMKDGGKGCSKDASKM